jgi:adenylate cyclase
MLQKWLKWLNQPIRVEKSFFTVLEDAKLWDVIADTDRLNRAIGVPPFHVISSYRDSTLPLHKVMIRRGIAAIAWDEYPFEWQRGSYHQSFREFRTGISRNLFCGIQLEACTDQSNPSLTGHRVIIFAEVSARTFLFKPVIWCLLQVVVRKAARYLHGRTSEASSAYKVSRYRSYFSKVNHATLSSAMARLREVPKLRSDLLRLLESHIRNADDGDISDLLVNDLATRWGQDSVALFDVFVEAARVGILIVEWALLCPSCSNVAQKRERIVDIPDVFFCEFCSRQIVADFASSIDQRFYLNPSIRAVNRRCYCLSVPARTPHVLAQLALRPGAERLLPLPSAMFRVFGIRHAQHEGLLLPPTGVDISIYDDRLLHQDDSSKQLRIRNSSSETRMIRVEEVGFMSRYSPGIAAITHQKFRAYFASQNLAEDQCMNVGELGLLRVELFDRGRAHLSDRETLLRNRSLQRFVAGIANQWRGQVLQTSGNSISCSFTTRGHALSAAIEIRSLSAAHVQEIARDEQVDIRVGAISGPLLAISANRGNELYGRSIDLLADFCRLSNGDDVVTTKNDAHQVSDLIKQSGATIEHIDARAVRVSLNH